MRLKKCLLIIAGLVMTTSVFAAEDFKSEDFLKVLKEKRNLLKDYQLKPYVVRGVKYESRYVSSEGEGFYLQIRNESEVATYPKKNGKGEAQRVPDFTEQWGPYKTMADAVAAKNAIPKDSIYTFFSIAHLPGAYSTKWYSLQESLHKDNDRALTGCYAEQAKEFENAKADDHLGGFMKYLGLEVVKIQIFDLRKGVPREKPTRDLFGFGDFTISATLDSENNCKITKMADLRELFKSHIEHHKKLLTANFADRDAERSTTRRKLLREFQERLKLDVDRIRNPENFKAEPKKGIDKRIPRTNI